MALLPRYSKTGFHNNHEIRALLPYKCTISTDSPDGVHIPMLFLLELQDEAGN